MTDLGTLGGPYSLAYDINDSRQIVGEAYLSEDVDHAFVYADGIMTDLNTLTPGSGWTLTQARAINDLGQIVGYRINPSGQEHAFLLTPIPEPAGLSLLVLAGLSLLRRRRRGSGD
jgi:probable HAF family extracellular repeat protein